MIVVLMILVIQCIQDDQIGDAVVFDYVVIEYVFQIDPKIQAIGDDEHGIFQLLKIGVSK